MCFQVFRRSLRGVSLGFGKGLRWKSIRRHSGYGDVAGLKGFLSMLPLVAGGGAHRV